MRVLVLGATGMAGHTIAIYLSEQGHDVTSFSRREFPYCCNKIIGDVTDFELLDEVIGNGEYDAVINAIGILNRDAEEKKSLAVLLNSYLPHYLSEITANKDTRVVQISTDCVFTGKAGWYDECSLRDAESFYGRSKALGELESNKDLTIRRQ